MVTFFTLSCVFLNKTQGKSEKVYESHHCLEIKYIMKRLVQLRHYKALTNRTYWQKVVNMKQQQAQVRVFESHGFMINLSESSCFLKSGRSMVQPVVEIEYRTSSFLFLCRDTYFLLNQL